LENRRRKGSLLDIPKTTQIRRSFDSKTKRSFEMSPLSKSQIIMEEYKSEDEQSQKNHRFVMKKE
jgi:hypothetical protein